MVVSILITQGFLAVGLSTESFGFQASDGEAWLIEARGLANRNEDLGRPGPVDKSEGFGWAWLA